VIFKYPKQSPIERCLNVKYDKSDIELTSVGMVNIKNVFYLWFIAIAINILGLILQFVYKFQNYLCTQFIQIVKFSYRLIIFRICQCVSIITRTSYLNTSC